MYESNEIIRAQKKKGKRKRINAAHNGESNAIEHENFTFDFTCNCTDDITTYHDCDVGRNLEKKKKKRIVSTFFFCSYVYSSPLIKFETIFSFLILNENRSCIALDVEKNLDFFAKVTNYFQ